MNVTTLTIDLPSDLYERLRAEAQRVRRPVEELVEAWVAEHRHPLAAIGHEPDAGSGRKVMLSNALVDGPTC